jgi:hypothetical protein
MVLRVPTMRNGVTCTVVFLAVAFLGGCASKEIVAAKAPAAPHISVAMDEETKRALLGEEEEAGRDPYGFDWVGPVGTTTLTSAELYVAPKEAKPQELPNERGSMSVIRTWGAPDATDVDGIPTTRER